MTELAREENTNPVVSGAGRCLRGLLGFPHDAGLFCFYFFPKEVLFALDASDWFGFGLEPSLMVSLGIYRALISKPPNRMPNGEAYFLEKSITFESNLLPLFFLGGGDPTYVERVVHSTSSGPLGSEPLQKETRGTVCETKIHLTKVQVGFLLGHHTHEALPDMRVAPRTRGAQGTQREGLGCGGQNPRAPGASW